MAARSIAMTATRAPLAGLATLGANTFTGAQDIGGAILVGDAANILALRNGGTNLSAVPQTFRVYNFYTDASNYERASLSWSANKFTINSGDALGTGTSRDLSLLGGGTSLDVTSTAINMFRNGTSNSSLFNASGTSLTSTAQNFFRLTPTINQTVAPAAGTYTVLDINPTETSIGAGPHYLIRGRIAAGSNVFEVQNNGTLYSVNSYISAGGYIGWSGRAFMRATADGVIKLGDNTETTFGRLQFGGTSSTLSAFPAIARSGTTLKFRTADDLNDAPITAAAATFSGALTVPGVTTAALTSTGTFTSGAGAQVGTLTNAPAAGNPTTWIKIIDNGVTRYIPAW